MSVQWNGKKLFELLVLNETKVAELYKTLAAEVKGGKGAQFLLNMAVDEERHAKMYEKLAQQLPNDGVIEIDEEDANFMEQLMDSNIFKDEEETVAKARKLYDRHQALDLAEKVERDAVQYVTEVIRLFPNVAPDQMSIVLKEEKKHLTMVLERKKENAFQGMGF